MARDAQTLRRAVAEDYACLHTRAPRAICTCNLARNLVNYFVIRLKAHALNQFAVPAQLDKNIFRPFHAHAVL